MNEERIGYSSGWTVEEDPEGGFRWAAHGPGGILWTAALGSARVLRTEAWGPLTERRLLLAEPSRPCVPMPPSARQSTTEESTFG